MKKSQEDGAKGRQYSSYGLGHARQSGRFIGIACPQTEKQYGQAKSKASSDSQQDDP